MYAPKIADVIITMWSKRRKYKMAVTRATPTTVMMRAVVVLTALDRKAQKIKKPRREPRLRPMITTPIRGHLAAP